MLRTVSVSACLMLVLGLHGIAYGQKWGDVSGQFVFEGTAPALPDIKADKDVAFCGKFKIPNETVVVGADGGLADVVLWLAPEKGAALAVHESYKAAEGAKVRVDNTECRFAPHITVLRSKQVLVAGNKDAVAHNTFVQAVDNPSSNPLIPAGSEVEIKNLTKEESLPVKVSCSIHPWMTSFIVVKDHPYAIVSGKDGKFTLKNVPAGDWTFKVWHEPAYVKGLKVGGAAQEIKRGSWKLSVKEGANDLGKISVTLASPAG